MAHFAKNPDVGGNPAKVAMITMIVHGLNLPETSFVTSLILNFVIGVITSRIETQYNPVKVNNVFILLSTAIIIHPRLKMEERAKISKIVLVVICNALPMRVESSIDRMINGFIINMSK